MFRRHHLVIAALVVVAWCAAARVSIAQSQTEELERGGAAEEERELETDRDAFTPATSTVGQRVAVLESSYSFINNRTVAETHSFPELLVRYGISERIELRVGWNFEVGGTGDVVSGNEGGEDSAGGIERESQMLYGFKVAVSDQRGWMPRSAVILQGFTPTSGEAPATDVVTTYTFGWELDERWRLDSSMRYGTEHGPHDAFNQWAPSVVLRATINAKWHAHVEYLRNLFTRSRTRLQPGLRQPGRPLQSNTESRTWFARRLGHHARRPQLLLQHRYRLAILALTRCARSRGAAKAESARFVPVSSRSTGRRRRQCRS
ncbi:MAG TPA: transporter, partial [Pirellulales bacterium]|nr:transporter [Pirellulales bacterium]